MEISLNHHLCFFFIVFTLFNASAFGDWNILQQQQQQQQQRVKNKLSSMSLKNYCESWRMNVELHNIRDFDVVPEECIEIIGKYMKSTQYKVDVEGAFDEVRLYIGTSFSLKGDGKDAWIFDIDDTLLSTLPYYKMHNFGGDKLNKSCLEAWMKEVKAPAVENAVDLFNAIRRRGLKIFLISSRREVLRDATIDNLVKVGYHGWTGLILRGLGDDGKTVESYKAGERKRLIDGGYRLWGAVGGQWSSLKGSSTPKRTFKLPNSFYYVA